MKISGLTRRHLSLALSFALLIAVFFIAGAENVIFQLQRQSVTTLLMVFALVLTVPLWAAIRFWRVLAHFGVHLPWSACFQSTVAGQVASLFFIPLFGQVAGRHVLMSESGVPPEANAAIAIYERLTTAVISAAGAVFGIIYLGGGASVFGMLTKLELLPITLAALGAVIVYMAIGTNKLERVILKRLFVRKNLMNLVEILLFAAVGYAVMILAFVFLFQTIVTDVSIFSLVAAAAIISFAASIPIGVGGWGLREVASVYVLGWFGISASDALAVSIVVGTLSTLAVLLIALCVNQFGKAAHTPGANSVLKIKKLELDKLSSWVLGVLVAVLVFFQVQVEMAAAVTRVNLADPFAVLGLTSVFLSTVYARKLPQWQVQNFNRVLLAFSLMWVIGFGWGYLSLGFIPWAFSGKLLGWLVCLGYLSVGYLIFAHHGTRSIRRISETLLSAAAIVVLMSWFMVHMPSLMGALYRDNFEGFAGNRNAFALQMLTVAVICLGYSRSYEGSPERIKRGTWIGALLGIVFVGVIWSASRTAMVTLGVVLLISWVTHLANRRVLLMAAATCGLMLLIEHASLIAAVSLAEGDAVWWVAKSAQSEVSRASSDAVRWEVNWVALDMWQQSKLLGIGLGGFLTRSTEYFDIPIVIHSTPIWILTEMGIVGATCLLYGVVKLTRHVYKYWNTDFQNRALFLILIVFAISSLVHEVMFQRIFWFALGLLLAGVPKLMKGKA